jgi:hypothetical protein
MDPVTAALVNLKHGTFAVRPQRPAATPTPPMAKLISQLLALINQCIVNMIIPGTCIKAQLALLHIKKPLSLGTPRNNQVSCHCQITNYIYIRLHYIYIYIRSSNGLPCHSDGPLECNVHITTYDSWAAASQRRLLLIDQHEVVCRHVDKLLLL